MDVLLLRNRQQTPTERSPPSRAGRDIPARTAGRPVESRHFWPCDSDSRPVRTLLLEQVAKGEEARTRPMVGRLLAGSCLMAVCVIIHAAGLSSAIRQLRRSALPASRFWRSTWL